jgi:hypothetical protein
MSEIADAVDVVDVAATPTVVCTLPGGGGQVIVTALACDQYFHGTVKPGTAMTQQMKDETLERLDSLVNGITDMSQEDKTALLSSLEAAVNATQIAGEVPVEP